MNVSIIGGDIRNYELAKILDSKHNLRLYGFEKNENNVFSKISFEEAIEKSQIIITPIPISKDNIVLNMPFANKKLSMDDFTCKCTKKTIITGNILEKYKNVLEENNNIVKDILKLDEYAILNGEPTAEGAIQIAMENTRRVLQKSNILILGYGKIGKILASKLQKLDCNVYCSARKQSDFAWMEVNNINQVKYEELLETIKNMDIIFNTVPSIILNEKEIENIKQTAIYIELASKPGGIDLEIAQKLEKNIINAQGLPGKVAPVTSAQILAKILENI